MVLFYRGYGLMPTAVQVAGLDPEGRLLLPFDDWETIMMSLVFWGFNKF